MAARLLHFKSDDMKIVTRLQYSTRAGRVARVAALLALTIALGLNLAVIYRDSAMVPSTPTESTPPEKNNTHKTGPWHYPPVGTRV
jgi:hypothetical protein